MKPEQIWVHTVCHRGFLKISADEKNTTFVAIGALRGKGFFDQLNPLFCQYFVFYLFDLILYVSVNNFSSYVGTGLSRLNQY